MECPLLAESGHKLTVYFAMNKILILINLLAILLLFVSVFWIYTSHTEFSETKNDALQKQVIAEINNQKDIELLRESHLNQLSNFLSSSDEHYKEASVIAYILLVIAGLLILNLILILNKNSKL